MRPSTTRPSLALTLSGGGLRATLYHLGVLRFLQQQKVLERVTHICSVSGGSILAAHLVLNWDSYTKDEQFDAIAEKLIEFTRGDVRGRIVRRIVLRYVAFGTWIAILPLIFFL